MRIGKGMYGHVDQVMGQGIKTNFLVIGLPIIPLESMFLIREDNGMSIPLYRRSVLFSYLRTILFIFTVWGTTFGLMGVMEPDFNRRALGDWAGGYSVIVMGLISAALLYISVVKLGVESEDRVFVRKIVGQVTQIYVHPDILSPESRALILSGMHEKWKALISQESITDWREAADLPEKSAIHLHALAIGFFEYQNTKAEADKRIIEKLRAMF